MRATSESFQTMEGFYFSDFSILPRQRQKLRAMFSQNQKTKSEHP